MFHGTVYDVTRRDTFTNLSDIWAKEIDLYSTNQDCIKMLVGNKVDKVFPLLALAGSLFRVPSFLCGGAFTPAISFVNVNIFCRRVKGLSAKKKGLTLQGNMVASSSNVVPKLVSTWSSVLRNLS